MFILLQVFAIKEKCPTLIIKSIKIKQYNRKMPKWIQLTRYFKIYLSINNTKSDSNIVKVKLKFTTQYEAFDSVFTKIEAQINSFQLIEEHKNPI